MKTCWAQYLLWLVMAVLGTGSALSACGQKGALFIPDEAKKPTPSQQASPAKEPSANEEPSADKEPSANKEPSATDTNKKEPTP